MPTWKLVVLRSIGFGAGFALVLCIAVGVWVWHSSRPVPPAPWNDHAIVAEYESVTTKGEENHLSFVYVLQNNTDSDYRLSSMEGVDLTAKLERSHSFGPFGGLKEALEFPIFVPAKSRTRLTVTIPYSYTVTAKDGSTRKEQPSNDSEVAKFVGSAFSNLDGFVLFDNSSHYKIDFPAGWTRVAKP